MSNKFYTNSTYGDLLFVVQRKGYGKTYFEKERNKRMSTKLYKEILDYIDSTKQLINSYTILDFDEETLKEFKHVMLCNVESLKEQIDKIIDKN